MNKLIMVVSLLLFSACSKRESIQWLVTIDNREYSCERIMCSNNSSRPCTIEWCVDKSTGVKSNFYNVEEFSIKLYVPKEKVDE